MHGIRLSCIVQTCFCAVCIALTHSIIRQPLCVCVCVCVLQTNETCLQQVSVCICPCRENNMEKGSYKMGASDPTTPNQVTSLVMCITRCTTLSCLLTGATFMSTMMHLCWSHCQGCYCMSCSVVSKLVSIPSCVSSR